MKEITRSEAEALFQTHSVKDQTIHQTNQELSIVMAISDDDSLIVRYDVLERRKSYFLQSK